jgi:hypothetical protein
MLVILLLTITFYHGDPISRSAVAPDAAECLKAAPVFVAQWETLPEVRGVKAICIAVTPGEKT